MAFFDKLGETISNKSKNVAKKAIDFAEVTNLNSQISTHEDVMNKAYVEIGEAYFEQNKSKESDPFVGQIHDIQDAKLHIDQFKLQIQKIKGVRNCTACGAEMQFNALFCPGCGGKAEPLAAPETPVENCSPVKVCASCGGELPENSTFCVLCGTKVN